MLATKPIQRMVGISTVLSHRTETWDTWKDLGVKSVRAEFLWSEIEANRGQYKWGVPDALVTMAHERGIRLLIVVNYAPAWAVVNEATFFEGVRQLAAKLGERYSYEAVPMYEIFNEPNLNGYGWPYVENNPELAGARYGKAVKAFHDGFRSKNTEAALVAGALSSHGLDIERFVNGFALHVPSDTFDVFSVHPYGAFHQLRQAQINVQEGILAKGYSQPVWFTEMGHNDDRDRTTRLNQVFQEVPGLNSFFWFCERDFKWFGYNFGSMEYWGSKKPDYVTLKSHMLTYSR